MFCGCIYKIPFPNGKHYIGQTTTSRKQREKEHRKCAKNGHTNRLYTALRKYDMVDTFELIEIDTADTLEELCKMEISYIKEYNSYYKNNGYNMTFGGEGTNGYIFTEEDKQRASEKTKKYFENPEARQKQSDLLKKHFENPEAREQLSKIKKKYLEDNPDVRKKMSESQKKRFENLHEREKHSEITTKYFEDNPEARENASKITTTYFENPENKKKHSEIKKKYFEDNPDAGKEQGERMKKYYEDNPEAKEQMCKIKKKYYEENPEARRNISKKRRQHNQFDVFTIDGTFINTFTYQFEAKEYLQTEYKITSTFKISEVLAGRRKSSAGFVFKYK